MDSGRLMQWGPLYGGARADIVPLVPFLPWRFHFAGALLLCTAGCAVPPPPPDPQIVGEWQAATDNLLDRADPRVRIRGRALAALAMYEAYVAEDSAPLRSLAGQVNGLWRVPGPAARALDGAIAAAEAQRVVLDSLLAADSAARRAVDSLAAAHIAARRAAGVREEAIQRSAAHGAAIGRSLLALAAGDARGTLVLRHPQECVFRTSGAGSGFSAPSRPEDVVQAGVALVAPVHAAVEARVIATLTTADSTAATPRDAPAAECVRALVRGRIRTRAAGR